MSDIFKALDHFLKARREHQRLQSEADGAYWRAVSAKAPLIRLVSKEVLGKEDEYTRDPRVLARVNHMIEEGTGDDE